MKASDACGNPIACAAKMDRDPESWVLVPKGTCAKIAGGMVTDKPENQHGGAAEMEKKG